MNLPSRLPKQVTDKFTVENNTLKRDAKSDPLDRISVEIGDSKQPDFKPQAKIARWQNEVNFSIRGGEDPQATVEVEGEVVKYKGQENEIHLYEKPDAGEDGGFEFEWVLPQKPKSNVLSTTIQSKGLNFHYQPELTQEEIDEGAHRPEHVVGSYAVYHATKGGSQRSGGQQYKTGKFCHIYRPKVTDAEGNEVWGELNITGGQLTVTVPQKFLDNAVYPVVVDPTFGYDTIGGSNTVATSDMLRSSRHTPTENGKLVTLHAYGEVESISNESLMGLYTSGLSADNLLDSSTEYDPGTGSPQWHEYTGLSGYSFSESIEYRIAHHSDNGIGSSWIIYYDTVTDGGDINFEDYTGTLPDPFDFNDNRDNQYSIYATYSPIITHTLDVNTVGENTFSVEPEVSTPRSIDFNNDGSKMFIVGNSSEVFEYNLSANFDISTAVLSQSFDADSQFDDIYGITFNDDGTRMYLVGINNGFFTDNVSSYVLSTGFDVSTSSFNTSFDVGTQTSSEADVEFNDDGSKMYVVDRTNNTIYSYNLSTNYDVSSASYSGDSLDTSGIGSSIPHDLVFNNDGSKLFVLDSPDRTVYVYSLSTNYDVSTASTTSESFAPTSDLFSPEGLSFNDDGTKLYILDGGGEVEQYNVCNPYDLYTAQRDVCAIQTHTVDVNASSGNTLGTDFWEAVFDVTEEKSHTIDALSFLRETSSHLIDARTRTKNQETHSVDIAVAKRQEETHTLDTITHTTNGETHSVDTLARTTNDESHTVDALARTINEEEHTLDTASKTRNESTHSVDTTAKTANEETHSVDVSTKQVNDEQHSVDSLAFTENEETHSVDTLAFIEDEETHSVDTTTRQTNEATHSVDTLIGAENVVTHEVDTRTLKTQEQTHSVDLLVAVQQEETHTIDTAVKEVLSETHTLDALTFAVKDVTHTLDTFVGTENTETHGVDVLTLLRDTQTYTADALTFLRETATHTIDVVFGEANAEVHTVDVLAAKDHTLGTDLWESVETKSATHTIDVTKAVRQEETHSLDVLANTTNEETHTLDVATKTTNEEAHTVDTYTVGTITRDHTLDIATQGTFSESHKVDILIEGWVYKDKTGDTIWGSKGKTTDTSWNSKGKTTDTSWNSCPKTTDTSWSEKSNSAAPTWEYVDKDN